MMSRLRSLGSRKGRSRCYSVSPSGDVAGEKRITAGEEAEEGRSSGASAAEEGRWSRMLPELMGEIIQRVETSEDQWPGRGSVVSCACVCRRWRDLTTGIVGPPSETGMITFPSSLKQPGPRDCPIQCFVKRNKKTSTFYLYLSLSQSLADNGKFLLAAQRFRHGPFIEYIISLDADDLSQGSNAYVGKLRSDIFGVKFTIYDTRPPYNGAKASSNRGRRRFASKQISPQVPASNFETGQVSYKCILIIRSRGPRRMLCRIECPPVGETTEEEAERKSMACDHGAAGEFVVLKNKAPRWHEHLQCWCLNFHGRVTVASVKNFQLVAAADANQSGGMEQDETVLLQFGRVGDDVFTMDYRHPLSAFQAFAICLTSFGSKFTCE